jgi:hypothetical protein
MAIAAGTLLTIALFEPDADASVGIGDALAPPLSRPTAPASWRSGRRHWRAIPAGISRRPDIPAFSSSASARRS